MFQRMNFLFSAVIVLAFIGIGTAVAQQQPSPAPATPKDVSFYRLDFVVRELEADKIINSRSYGMWLKADRVWQTLRAGNDMPVQSIPTQEKPAQQSYRHIGVQFDCALDEIDNNAVAMISASIVAILPTEQPNDQKPALPAFRTITFKSASLLTPGKPTMVSSIDDPNGKRRFQLEITATKLK
jgi:hypothetical protein